MPADVATPAFDDADDQHTAVLRLEGDIDLASESVWRERGEQVLARVDELSELVLDMSQVSFIDSRGLALLVHFYRVMLRRGGRLVLSNVPRRVDKALQLAGLQQLLRPDAL